MPFPTPPDSAYENDELNVRKLSGADLIQWEWNFAHSVPKQRRFDFEEELTKVNKHLRYDSVRGTEVIFNYHQEALRTDFEVPYVGREPTTIGNEIWMGFYPSKVDLRGTVFQRIGISNVALQSCIVEHFPGRFLLDPTTVKEWLLVERRLQSIIGVLRPHIPFPQTVTAPRPPAMMRYSDEYPTKEKAFDAARRARNAFLSLQAYLSFLVSFWHDSRSRPLDSVASWLSAYLRIDPIWMTKLITLHPIAYTESVTRLGMTMNHASPWVRFLPLFIDCNVRVGLYTSRTEFELPKSDLSYLYLNGRPLCEQDDDCEDCVKRRINANPLRAQDAKEFLVGRLKEWVEFYENSEVSSELAEYMHSRDVSDNSNGEQIRAQGWKVYEWGKIGGVYRRMAVPRSMIPRVVDAYPWCYRHVSPLVKELDLCNKYIFPSLPHTSCEFPSLAPIDSPHPATLSPSTPAPTPPDQVEISKAPNAVNEGEVSGGEKCIANVPSAASALVADIPHAASLSATITTESPLDHIDFANVTGVFDDREEGELSDDEQDMAHVHSTPSAQAAAAERPQFKTVLADRFGFEWDGSSGPPHCEIADIISVFDGDKGLSKSMQVLGLRTDQHMQYVTEEDRIWLAFAFRLLHSKELTIKDLPAPFDISTRGPLILLSRFQIEQVQNSDGPKVVKRFAIGIKGQPMNEQWFVVVVDGAALLEIGRGKWTGILQICRELARQSIPFFTAKYHCSSTKPTIRDAPRTGLGIFTTKTISAEGYRIYEEQRDEFLAGPRGGLALQAGGFLARLASNVVDVKKAAIAPSKDAKYHGRYLGKTRSGYSVISDYLEFHEVDQVLGRFLYLRSDRVQLTVTLWPPNLAWLSSGLNIGQWNEEAEHWYRRRLDAFEKSHTFEAETSQNWRSQIRSFSKARDIWKRYTALATEYLSQEYL